MPIAELLGVQVDMQLLLKLSFSVAAVLLVSWAYKFYSSRDAKTTQLCAGDEGERGKATCTNCKMTLQRQSSPNQDTKDGAKLSKPGDLTVDCSKAEVRSASSTNNEASGGGKQSEVGEILRCQNSTAKDVEDESVQSKPGDSTYESTKDFLQQQIDDTEKGEKQSETVDMTINDEKETLRHRSPTNYNKDKAKQSKVSELLSKSTLQTPQGRSSQINNMDNGVSQSKPGVQMLEHSEEPRQRQSSPNSRDYKASQSKPGDAKFNSTKTTQQRGSSANKNTDNVALNHKPGDVTSISIKEMTTQHRQSLPNYVTEDEASRSKPDDQKFNSTKDTLQHQSSSKNDTATQPRHGELTLTDNKDTSPQHLQSSSSNILDYGTTPPKPGAPVFISATETVQRQDSAKNDTATTASQPKYGDSTLPGNKEASTQHLQSSSHNILDYGTTPPKLGAPTETVQRQSSTKNDTTTTATKPKYGGLTFTGNKETSTQQLQSSSSNILDYGTMQSIPGTPTETVQCQSPPNKETATTATKPKYGGLTFTGNKERSTQHLQSSSSNILDYGTTQPKPGAPTETVQHQSSPNKETDFRAKQAKPGALMSTSTKTKEHPSSPNYVTQSKIEDSTLEAIEKMLLLRSLPKHVKDKRVEKSKSGASKSVEICKNESTHGADAEPTKSKLGDPKEHPTMSPEQSKDAVSRSNSGQDMLPLQKQAEDATGNILSLNLPHPTESGTASATGRRSPCFLQKLEGGVGVGRELRQDLERQGAYSSFTSKAEIKVEDANVLLEGKEKPVVRGKIYDYYVESSSHSITDRAGRFERKCESQPSCSADSPSSFSPIVLRDLAVPQNATEDLYSTRSPPSRPVLLRKESYLSAAEQSELPIPSPTRMTHSLTSAGDESITVYHMILSSTERDASEAAHETAAGALFSLPAAHQGADLENLKSKLDLGNCLEALCLAKKHGQASVQQAALGVMSDNYLQVLMDPNLYGRLLAGEREQIRKQRMKGRRFVMVADMDPQDWARGPGTKQRRTSSAMYCYDDYADTWHQLCHIPPEVVSKACAMCTMDNYLFVAVGCQGSEREMAPSKRVFCFNPLTSIWKEISPMNEARPRCKLAALEGYVYAIGGECLSSVERYDPRLDRWTFVAPLPNDTFAVAHHVTASDGELFVSGGTLRYMLLRYNPKTDTWRPSRVVSSKDRTADMVAVGRFLYRFDVNPLLGVSVYRYHTVARLWYECSSRRLQRCPAFQCVAVDNTVFCVSRHFTMKFDADEISPAFVEEDLSVLSAAKGILYPFVLSLPDKTPRQTSV